MYVLCMYICMYGLYKHLSCITISEHSASCCGYCANLYRNYIFTNMCRNDILPISLRYSVTCHLIYRKLSYIKKLSFY